MTTDPSTGTLYDLYHSGAYLCLGILAVYFLLKYLSTSSGKIGTWLKVPGRAHYVTAALGVIGLFMGPLTQGKTPNAMMFFTSMPAIFALLLPGAPKKTDAAPSQAGFAKLGVLLAIACMGSCVWGFGCGASANFDTRVQTVVTGVTYAQLAVNQFDTQHEKDIALTCGNGITDPVAAKADCTAKTSAYRAELAKFNIAFGAAMTAIKAVVKLKNDQTVAGAEAAALIVAQELAALGVK